MKGESSALPVEVVGGLLAACEGGEPLAARLRAALGHLRPALGAQAAGVGLVLPEGLWLLARDGPLGAAEAAEGAALELTGRWRLWVVPTEAARDGPLLRLARHLLRRELERELQLGAATQDGALRGAVAHELGNALTPLLCHGNEAIAREAGRARQLLDVLRQLGGGRGGPPSLLTAAGFLERVRRIALKLPETPLLQVEVDPRVAGLALGSEQRELLPLLLRALVAVRGAQAPVRLRAQPDPEAGLRLELEARQAEPPLLALDLEDVPGLTLRRELHPGRITLRAAPAQRPRAVLLCTPDSAARLERGLLPLGLAVVRARDAAQVAQSLADGLSVWAVLVDDALQAEALVLRRLLLERRLGLRAQVPLVLLGPDLLPQGLTPGPDEVDLARLLGA